MSTVVIDIKSWAFTTTITKGQQKKKKNSQRLWKSCRESKWMTFDFEINSWTDDKSFLMPSFLVLSRALNLLQIPSEVIIFEFSKKALRHDNKDFTCWPHPKTFIFLNFSVKMRKNINKFLAYKNNKFFIISFYFWAICPFTTS